MTEETKKHIETIEQTDEYKKLTLLQNFLQSCKYQVWREVIPDQCLSWDKPYRVDLIFEIPLPFTILGHKSVEHTCGMLTFPITFLLGDLINEYYGPKATKQTVYIGLIMSVMVFTVMNIAQALPYLNKPFNVTPAAFNMIFGSAKLMYVASIAAYLVGQLLDIWLFGVIKKITKGEYLWVRATGSTLISQLIDSFVVSYIAFGFGKRVTGQTPASLKEVWNIACTGYGLKFVIAALITPILYALRDFMHKKFGLEPVPLDYEENK
jgi:uncharacterized integral membrane protein (TIGR00697 family)